FVLLTAQFRASTARWLLILAAAYLYSGLMALLHFLTFPGAAIGDQPLLGVVGTVGWLYLFWSLGFVALTGVAILARPSRGRSTNTVGMPVRALGVMVAAVLAGVGGLFAIGSAGIDVLPALTVGDRFSAWGIAGNGVRGLMAALALVGL